ncbi:hypothetical protein Droror1_Dr00005042 [Drosera rotundifolia]
MHMVVIMKWRDWLCYVSRKRLYTTCGAFGEEVSRSRGLDGRGLCLFCDREEWCWGRWGFVHCFLQHVRDEYCRVSGRRGMKERSLVVDPVYFEEQLLSMI